MPTAFANACAIYVVASYQIQKCCSFIVVFFCAPSLCLPDTWTYAWQIVQVNLGLTRQAVHCFCWRIWSMGCARSKTSPAIELTMHPTLPTPSMPLDADHQEMIWTFLDRRLPVSEQQEDEHRQERPSIYGYLSGEEPPKLQSPMRTGAFATLPGLEPAPGGTVAKVNQDRGLVIHPWCSRTSMALFGVYDGHGRRGHEVSEFVVKTLPDILRQVQAAGKQDLGDVLEKSYMLVDTALRSSVDASVSGTTAITCFLKQNDLFIANTGDSRAIACRRHESPSGFRLEAIHLTIDHKPDSPHEMERIRRMAGSVSPAGPHGRPARVWHGKRGLAMSRSIGDHAAATVGVIARPDIMECAVANNEPRCDL